MHVHRFAHPNGPGGNGGGWHKDSYWGYGRIRDHHPRWIHGDVLSAGRPGGDRADEGAVPGSQYFESRVKTLPPARRRAERPGRHRASGDGRGGQRDSDPFRPLAPSVPQPYRPRTVHVQVPVHPPRRADASRPGARKSRRSRWASLPITRTPPIWREMWRWLAAEPEAPSSGVATELGEDLESESEEVRLPAAYALGGLGDEGRVILKAGLHSERDEVRRASAYGLSTAGASAVGDLTDALTSENDRTRGYAVFALGDLGAKAESAVPALAALAQRSVGVRPASARRRAWSDPEPARRRHSRAHSASSGRRRPDALQRRLRPRQVPRSRCARNFPRSFLRWTIPIATSGDTRRSRWSRSERRTR